MIHIFVPFVNLSHPNKQVVSRPFLGNRSQSLLHKIDQHTLQKVNQESHSRNTCVRLMVIKVQQMLHFLQSDQYINQNKKVIVY